MTTTTNNATIAKELTEALGNTLAFGDHLGRVSKQVALDLSGYSEAEAEEIRKLVFFDDLPSECPAYVENYQLMTDEVSGESVIDRLALDGDGTQKDRTIAEDISHESLGYGSVSNAHVIAEHLQGFVGTLACWKSGFDSEKYERHQTKAAKVRRYQSISEHIFDSAGRVKSLDGDKKPRRRRVARAATRNAKKAK